MELGIGGLGHATEIGAGASAVVYRALQVDLDREVAVKVLSATDEAFVRRFHREAMTLGKLSLNPGIVTVHGTGVTESGHPYLILELCESSVLDHLKTQGRFDPMDACRVGAQVADAVSDAHNNGVVHRDIKPGNLLRSQKGRYLITDFGIATVRGSTLGQTDSIGFTAGYVAPETLRGEEAGTPSDVYALGATLFHMLAGYPPFVDQSGNSNLLALAQRVINDPVPDLRLHGVPDDVCRIVEAAMAKHPADRPSAAQLRDQLQAVVEPNRPYPPPVPAQAGGASTGAPSGALHNPQNTIAADQTAAYPGPEVAGTAAAAQPLAPAGYSGADQTTAMTGVGAPSAAPPPRPQNNAGPPNNQGHGAGGVLLESNTNAAVPPGQANYPLPPHSDDGPQPWKLLLLGMLAGTVILLATIAIAVNRSNNDDGVDTTDAAPESPLANDDASEGDSDDGDTNGVANSLPDNSTDAEETAPVPDVVGVTEGDARSRLIGEGFEVLVQERTSSTVAPGSVVAQDPAANSEQNIGSVVMIFVAVAPEIETVTIPTLAGLTEEQAVAALTDLGLNLGDPILEFSETPSGEVIRSAPDVGTAVDAGSDIVLIVSKGLAPPTCAQLVDLAEAEATTLIEAAGLTAVITPQESATEPEGEVISCEVAETSISLVVSDGPEICGVVTGMLLAEGTAALEAKGYTVTATGALRPALPVGEIFACEKQGTTATVSYAEGLPTVCPAAATGATAAEARALLEGIGFTDITAVPTESDTVPAGEVIACQIAGEAVTLQVSSGPAVQTGRLSVSFDTLEIQGDCAGEGLRPDLYGQIGIRYDGQDKLVWPSRTRLQALTPNGQGVLDIDETKNWNGVETGGELTVAWDLKDTDRVGQPGDEDIIDDDVSAVTRTIQLTGADRAWVPSSDNNDECSLVINLTIEWTGLSD